MDYKTYKDLVKSDKDRYSSEINHWKLFFRNPCYKLGVRYRKCKYFGSHKGMVLLYFFERYLYNKTCTKFGCDIPSHVEIGAGFRMDHPHGIVINSRTVIGKNFTIKSGAVIGANEKGVPAIGNNVSIGVHALIIGKIYLGDGCEIGAGAIVTHDVPDNAVVVCEAAHIKRIRVQR